MPELPEVETVARQLAPHLRDARLSRLRVFDKKIRLPKRHGLTGARVRETFRLGKTLVICLERGSSISYVQVHLRMTGRLFWLPKQEKRTVTFGSYLRDVKGVSEKHRRAGFYFDTGSLFFVDPRRFGTISLCDSRDALHMPGREPLEPALTVDVLRELIGNSSQAIKVWLLRQDRLTGIGNIYASEVLFRAGIHPEKAARDVNEKEMTALHESIGFILRAAIERGGTTVDNFQTSDGSSGSFQELLRVYGRAGEQCRRCEEKIMRFVQAQRSTFYCPKCQAMAGSASSSTRMSA